MKRRDERDDRFTPSLVNLHPFSTGAGAASARGASWPRMLPELAEADAEAVEELSQHELVVELGGLRGVDSLGQFLNQSEIGSLQRAGIACLHAPPICGNSLSQRARNGAASRRCPVPPPGS